LRVIIPGSSGFIGRNLLTKIPPNWDTTAIYNSDKNFPSFIKSLNTDKIITKRCNLLNFSDLRSLQKNCGHQYDLCIYLAANSDPIKSNIDPSFDLRSNTESLTNFLQTFNIERFIFFSSGAVYEGHEDVVSPEVCVSPTLPYAISKLASEAYVRHFKRKGVLSEYLIVRFFGAYGPYESPRKIFTKLIKQFYFKRNEEFLIRGNGLNLIDAMYIDDVIEGIIKMANMPLMDSVIDFCGGSPLTIKDLVIKVANIFSITKPKIIHKGETVEYNKFFANPLPFLHQYDFKPKINLTEGIKKLARFLEEKRR
jgi:nucleoside-diphosphate-sugar epimerase